MLYTGIDYHRSFSYLTTMNEKGEIISQKKLPQAGTGSMTTWRTKVLRSSYLIH
jgi:hypothetical protein